MSDADTLALQIDVVPFRAYPSSGMEHPKLEDSLTYSSVAVRKYLVL